MLPHTAQALGHTLLILLSLAGAVGHGVFLSSLLENEQTTGLIGIATVIEVGWTVVLALYLISTMITPKNSKFIWVVTDVICITSFAAIGLGATILLAVTSFAHHNACRRSYGDACVSSMAGAGVSFAIVAVLLASALVEAIYVTKHHGKEGWFSSLRWLAHNTQGFQRDLRPLSLPVQVRQRQGTFEPIVVRKSKEFEDHPLLSAGLTPSKAQRDIMGQRREDEEMLLDSGSEGQGSMRR